MEDQVTRYSEACTRSGIAALAAAAVAFALIQRLSLISPLEAFGSYVLARQNLHNALEDITASPYSTTIRDTLHPNYESDDGIPVSELLDLICIESNNGLSVDTLTKTATVTLSVADSGGATVHSSAAGTSAPQNPTPSSSEITKSNSDPVAITPTATVRIPAAPVILSVALSGPCPGTEGLRATLGTLWNDTRLQEARSLHNDIEMEVYQWQLARSRVGARIALQMNTGKRQLAESSEPEYFRFNLGELRKLNSVHRPTIVEFSEMAHKLMRVETPYAPADLAANSAAAVLQAAIFIFVSYFFFMAKAAQVSSAMSEPSSLFAIHSAGPVGRVLFFFVALTPAISSYCLANVMRGAEEFWGILFMFGTMFGTAKSLELFVQFYKARKTG